MIPLRAMYIANTGTNIPAFTFECTGRDYGDNGCGAELVLHVPDFYRERKDGHVFFKCSRCNEATRLLPTDPRPDYITDTVAPVTGHRLRYTHGCYQCRQVFHYDIDGVTWLPSGIGVAPCPDCLATNTVRARKPVG